MPGCFRLCGRSKILRAILVTTVPLLYLAAVNSQEETAEETRLKSAWRSQDRGQVVFVNGRLGDIDSTHLCVMSLPGQAVEYVQIPDSVTVEVLPGAPEWILSRKEIVFYARTRPGESGIYLTELGKQNIRKVSESIRIPPLEDEGERIPVRERSGVTILYDPPVYYRWDIAISYASASRSLYIIRYNGYNQGPLGWRIDPDTLEVEEGIRSRLQRNLTERKGGWYELWKLNLESASPAEILLESLPLVNLDPPSSIVSLSVSPDESFITYSTHEQVYLCDLKSGEGLSPAPPPEYVAHHARFSPDGKQIAACGVKLGPPGQKAWSLLIADGPDFSNFREVWRPHRLYPMELAWSHNGAWILVKCKPPVASDAGMELYVVELASGNAFNLPRPYFLNGIPMPGLYTHGGIDWSE